MAYTSLPTVVPGDPVRASWGNQVDTDLDDLDTRVTTLETAVAGADLNGLDDVAIGSPLAAGNVLTYDGATWENAAPAIVPLATGVSGNLPLANLPTNFVSFLKSTIALTNAQIKTGGELTVVAATGANTRAKFFSATVRIDASFGAYTNIDAAAYVTVATPGEAVSISEYKSNNVAPALTYFTDLFGTANHRIADLGPYQVDTATAAGVVNGSSAVGRASVVNTALVFIIANGGSGALTGGHASNTGSVTVYYALETI